LLRVRFYQVALVVISLVAVLSNAACVPIRLAVHKESMGSSFSILVTNLNVANLLMGVYCGIIAGADAVFRGSFVHKEQAWTDSVLCRGAGFVYLLSVEVSAFTVVLVTWDRVSHLLCTLQAPSCPLGLGTRSSALACVVTWVVGLTWSTMFLFPSVSQWAAYRRSGVCLPLPVTADGRQGSYSVVTHAGVRPVLLLLAASGQARVYRRVRKSKSCLTTAERKALCLARQFMQVAVTDCVCWVVVSCATLWSLLSRVPVGEETAHALAIFLQPMNAALNPCLYLMSRALEDRRVQRQARLTQLIKNRLVCQK
jgi:hypothetical protein